LNFDSLEAIFSLSLPKLHTFFLVFNLQLPIRKRNSSLKLCWHTVHLENVV
jgi:hypothetical protein